MARRIEHGDLRAKQEMIERNLRLVFTVAKAVAGVAFSSTPDPRGDRRLGPRGRRIRSSARPEALHLRRLVDPPFSSRRDRGRTDDQDPAAAAQQVAAIRRAEAEVERDGITSASTPAIAERTGLSPLNVRNLRSAARVTASLEEPRVQSHNEVGDWLGVKEERNRQLEWEALKRLRGLASPSPRAA